MVGFISLFFICLGYAEAADPALPLLRSIEGATNDEVRRHIRQVANERLVAATAVLPPAASADQSRWSDYERRSAAWWPSRTTVHPDMLKLISGQMAEEAVVDWLGIEPPPFLSQERTIRTLSVKSEGLNFRVAGVDVNERAGTHGFRNGVLDRGEWVQLQLGVLPKSKPMFSTSAWVTSDEPCVHIWDADREQVVGEWRLADGEPKPVEVEVYISNDCRPGQRVPITMRLDDSHIAGSGEQLTTWFKVGPGNGSVPSVSASVELDMDIPGYSDGSPLPLEGGGKYELLVRAQVSGRYETNLQYRMVAGKGLFAETSDDAPSIVRTYSSSPRAEDDLDFKMASQTKVNGWVNSQRRPWTMRDDPYIPFAIDFMTFKKATPAKGGSADKMSRATERYKALISKKYNLGDPVDLAEIAQLVRAFEVMARDAARTPDWASSKEVQALVDSLLVGDDFESSVREVYWHRHVFMLPVKAAPPPPPPRRIVELPDPEPDPEPVPERNFRFAFGPSISTINIGNEYKLLIGGHASAGARIKGVIDFGLNSSSQYEKYGLFLFGGQASFVYTDGFEFGVIAQAGQATRSVEGFTYDGAIFFAGIAAEANLSKNFGAWFQVGGAGIDLPDSGGFRGALGLQLKL